MDALTVAAFAGRVATAGEANAVIASAEEASATSATIGESTEAAGEVSEVLIGENGLLEQLDAIHHSSLGSVSIRNELLLNTRNQELAGQVHPETGVPFEKDEVRLPDGTICEGVFPEFDATFEVALPDELLTASDYKQAQACNEQLRDAVDSNPSLKEQFNETQLQQIEEGETPDGYTWHHHQEIGKMQLVDSDVHRRTGHTGGKEIWGGGR